MTRIPGRPHVRRGRELMSLLASARPASLDPGPEPAPAAPVAARLAAAGPAEAGPELLAAGAGPGEARPTAPAGRPEVPGRLARPRLWASVAAAATVTAIALAATIIGAPVRSGRAGSGGTVSAAAVLDAAAAAAARQPAGHGKYYAVEYEDLWNNASPPVLVVNPWETLAANMPGVVRLLTAAQARELGGEQRPARPGRPLTAAVLPGIAIGSVRSSGGSVPGSVSALMIDSYRWFVDGSHSGPDLFSLVSPLFRALATIPGLIVIPHQRDLIGRAATVVYVPGGKASSTPLALFFDPVTSAFLGYHLGCGRYRFLGVAVLASGYVSSAQQLPPGTPAAPPPVVQPAPLPGCGSSATGPQPSPAATSSPTPSPSASPSPEPTVSPSVTPAPSPTPASPSPGPLPTASG
jgi:hypothetical protein